MNHALQPPAGPWGRAGAALRRGAGKLRRAGWALGDQCIVSVSNFLTIYLFARHFEAAAFGVFSLAYTGLLLLSGVQSALLAQPHNVLAAPLEGAAYRRFTAALALAQAALCAIAGAAIAAAAWIAAGQGAAAAAAVLLPLAFAAMPWMAQAFVRRVLYTRGETRAAALNDALTFGLQLAAAGWLVAFAPAGGAPGDALLVLGGASLAGTLFGLWQLRGHLEWRGADGAGSLRRAWSETWQFGKWLLAQNGVLWFGAQGHAWVVALLLGAEQVGLYRAATHLVNVMNPVLQTAISYLPPRGSLAYHAGGADGLARWAARSQRALVLATLPLCAVLAVFPQQILQFAYGDRYADGDMALILALSAIAVSLLFAKLPFDVGLMALRATRSIFRVYLVPVVLLLTAGVALINALGILGVPLSGLLINFALLLATWRAFRTQRRRAQSHPEVSPHA
jgi:O-antigen/teichoic acid export membrane protein